MPQKNTAYLSVWPHRSRVLTYRMYCYYQQRNYRKTTWRIYWEIVAKVMHVQHADEVSPGDRVSHIVVMGVGSRSITMITWLNSWKWSTLIKDLLSEIAILYLQVVWLQKVKFADEGLQVNLALSLHAPNNITRSRIMRINRKSNWSRDGCD